MGKRYIKKRDYPERAKLQGIESELEGYYLEMIEEHNIGDIEAVKIAMRFASFMTGLLKEPGKN